MLRLWWKKSDISAVILKFEQSTISGKAIIQDTYIGPPVDLGRHHTGGVPLLVRSQTTIIFSVTRRGY